MQRALRLQLRHARRYLIHKLVFNKTRRVRERHTIDERVQDGHGTVGDTSIWVNLLENCDALVICDAMREETR